ncbi:hypothetical protein C8R46DRAFT_1305636 [Mycena filopes]|nr:hypothetical protein C8R46DRAFT_1305636 [Mycena filopes]
MSSVSHPVWSAFNHRATKDLARFMSSSQLIQMTNPDTLFRAVITAHPALEFLAQHYLASDSMSTPDEFDQFWDRFDDVLARFRHFPRSWLNFQGPAPGLDPLPKDFKVPFTPPPSTLPDVEDVRTCEFWDHSLKTGFHLHNALRGEANDPFSDGFCTRPLVPRPVKKAKSAVASSSTAAPAASPSRPPPKPKSKTTPAAAPATTTSPAAKPKPTPKTTPSSKTPAPASSSAAKAAPAVVQPSASDGTQRVLRNRPPASERATEVAKQQGKGKAVEKRPGPAEASSSRAPPKPAPKQVKLQEPPAQSASPTPRPKKRKRIEEDEGEFMPGNGSDIELQRTAKAKLRAAAALDHESDSDADERPKNEIRIKQLKNRDAGDPNSAPVSGKTDFQSVIDSLTDAIKERLTLFKGRSKSKKFTLTELKSFNFAAPKHHGVFFGVRQKAQTAPRRFWSHLAPGASARERVKAKEKEIDAFKPQYLPFLKIPSVVVTEADFSSAGIPPAACLACILFRTECTRVAFGMSCVQCQARELKHCDHGQSIEELIRFYIEIASNYSLASDATELILVEFLASFERAQDAARLYRKASLDMASRFKFFVAHAYRCIDLMGEEKFRERFTKEEYTSNIPDIVDYINHLIAQFNEQCIPHWKRPDTIPADYEVPDPDRFFRPDHDTVLREFKRFLGPDSTDPNDVVQSIRHNLPKVFDSTQLLPSQSELGITAAQLAKIKRQRAGSLSPESEEVDGGPEDEDSGEEEDEDVKDEADDDDKACRNAHLKIDKFPNYQTKLPRVRFEHRCTFIPEGCITP